MRRLGRKVTCAKCGENVNAKQEGFECTACGGITCWACVANAYVAQHGWPPGPGDNRSAVMMVIMAMGDRGEAPCPLCQQTAAKRPGVDLPAQTRHTGPTGLDVFKQLPRTNCGDCGEPSCLAFAMKVANGDASFDSCPHVKT